MGVFGELITVLIVLGEVIAESENVSSLPKPHSKRPSQSNVERQVTLEDQAICGALQTLNEEALEDVLDEREGDTLASSELVAAFHGYNSSNLSTCSDPTETDVLYLQTSVVPELHHFPGIRPDSSVLGSRGFLGSILREMYHFVNDHVFIAGNEDSISIASSLVSLAERGTATPVRQRTVTEVVWPEHLSGMGGLRSQLASNTSLFRAGSQKSVITDGSYALSRRESQRSVTEMKTFNSSAIPSHLADIRADLTSSTVDPITVSGWQSEQGSPRRPASLVLTEAAPSHDWLSRSMNPTPESPLRQRKILQEDCTPTTGTSSPVILHKRFSTTSVELPQDQVSKPSKLEPANY